MKTLLTILIAGTSFVGCGHQLGGNSGIQSSGNRDVSTNSAARRSSNEIGIPESTSYIATVKSAQACAKDIGAIEGIKITNVLEAIDVVTFTSIPEQSDLVAKLPCVVKVELDGTVEPMPSEVGIPELTGYIATVKNAKSCAEKINTIEGIEITNVLETIDVVTFTSIPEQSELVAKLSCVVAVELDGTVHADPSTRIGN